MTTPAASTPRTTSGRFRRLFHRSDGTVDRALPSELALRPIEPHYLMRR